ncbi:phosphoserine phosphatase SerB [Thalassotalea euphylliae]|uniref:Phosphoserine phosphatase n=1 Tax=Thalassotalea euphylliae TaxID=1655234 RepID=A0A3E0ULF4_9GAMM|nr:phosphoserine phosphatase SerB [Thalassotalea euphylliae]
MCLSTTPSGFQFSEYQAQNSNIELVVFSSLSVSLLARIEQQCQLSLTALTAVNQRNQLESIRFAIECENITFAREQLVALTQSENFEAAIVTDAPRLDEPGLLVMDMDSTTIEIECIDEIAKLAGVGEKVAEVTELAMQGKLDFSQSLHQRVATLEGAPESILAAVANNLPLMAGLVSLVEALKTHNWRVAIASGGFTYFADHLKETLGLDAAYANTLEIVDEKLTGKVLGNVVDAQKKADVLVELAEQYGIKTTQTIAMGDGANDLVMMEAAHLGVAYKAKPLVLAKADSSISHSGLDCMLHWLK